MSCKRRGCEVCREMRRLNIAARVSYGLERLGGEGKQGGGAWQVLTFDRAIDKRTQNRISNQFIQWLKRYMKRVHNLDIEWVKVWERHRSGRLHLNLLISPWRYIPQGLLARKWHTLGGGLTTWVERVGRGSGAVARASRYKVGLYFGKYDQMVLAGKGFTYSKGWPRIPVDHHRRCGVIKWSYVGNVSVEGILHWYETELGNWVEVAAGEYAEPGAPKCGCFEFLPSAASSARRMMARLRKGVT